MSTVTGTIAFLNEKNFNGKMLYSLKLSNDDQLYLCGAQRPNAAKGDYVSFECVDTPTGKKQVDVKTLQVKTAQVVTPGGKESYWDKKGQDDKSRQATIEYQAARNSAIAAAGVILNAQAIKLPAKDADKYKVVIGLINDLTMKFVEETKTLGVKKENVSTDTLESAGTGGNGEGTEEGEWE